MFTVMEPDIQVPEVYRNTPFEHVTTAEAGQVVVVCTVFVAAPQAWVAKAGAVQSKAPLPSWIAVRPHAPPSTPLAELIFELPATPLV